MRKLCLNFWTGSVLRLCAAAAAGKSCGTRLGQSCCFLYVKFNIALGRGITAECFAWVIAWQGRRRPTDEAFHRFGSKKTQPPVTKCAATGVVNVWECTTSGFLCSPSETTSKLLSSNTSNQRRIIRGLPEGRERREHFCILESFGGN